MLLMAPLISCRFVNPMGLQKPLVAKIHVVLKVPESPRVFGISTHEASE